jgi:hypothetical protein
MPVQQRSVDVVVDGDGRRRVVGGMERDLLDAIWDQAMNQIPSRAPESDVHVTIP